MEEKSDVRKLRNIKQQDLTNGNPFKVLVLFTLPMLLSMVFQQLYNIVDSVVAGRFIGNNALAAVGASAPVTLLFLAVAAGCAIGGGVIVSQLFGRGEYERLKSTVFTGIIGATVLALVLTIVGLAICDPVLILLNTPKEILTDSSIYLSIYVWSLVFIFLYNMVTNIFNGLGDSRTPLYLLIFSSILNIILDLVFVIVFSLGVAGLAWATFIAQVIAAVAAFVCLIVRMSKLRTSARIKAFDFHLLKNILIIALPSICQQSFISVGQLCVQSVVNGFGGEVISGYTAAMRVSFMAVSCFAALSSALSSFTGQNIGAGKSFRVSKGLKSGIIVGAVLCVVSMTLFLCIGKMIIGLFIEGESAEAVTTAGGIFLSTVCLGYPFAMVKICVDGVLRGAGAMGSFMISTFSDLLIRVALSYALSPVFGFLGIALSYPIGWLCGMAVGFFLYVKGKWKQITV